MQTFKKLPIIRPNIKKRNPFISLMEKILKAKLFFFLKTNYQTINFILT